MTTCSVDEEKIEEAMQDTGAASVQEFVDFAIQECVARVALRRIAFAGGKAPDIREAFGDFHKLEKP